MERRRERRIDRIERDENLIEIAAVGSAAWLSFSFRRDNNSPTPSGVFCLPVVDSVRCHYEIRVSRLGFRSVSSENPQWKRSSIRCLTATMPLLLTPLASLSFYPSSSRLMHLLVSIPFFHLSPITAFQFVQVYTFEFLFEFEIIP